MPLDSTSDLGRAWLRSNHWSPEWNVPRRRWGRCDGRRCCGCAQKYRVTRGYSTHAFQSGCSRSYRVHDLVCLHVLLTVILSSDLFPRYLRTLKLDKDLLTMRNFNIYDPMKQGLGLVLDGQTLAHIEVLQNNEGTDEGSLLKLLGRCITPFGEWLAFIGSLFFN